MAQVFDRWDPAGYDPSNELIAGNVGGLAGAGAGALAGAAATSWSGPGALVGALIGGAAGGLGGQLSGFGNKTWTLKDDGNGNISFSPEEGEYVRYNNNSGSEKDLVDHMYWNQRTGDVYYKDPDSGKYTKLDTTGLDMSGGWLNYASDDQLDSAARAIASTIKGNRSYQKLKEQKEKSAQFSEVSDGLSSIAIPTLDNPTPEQLAEYTKRKVDAENLLQKLLNENSVESSTPEDTNIYYNYGPNQIDLKYYLHNLGTNLQKYIQSQDWSSAQKNAFVNSYNNYKNALEQQLSENSNRFSTDDAGNIIDSSGLLNTSGTLIVDEDGNIYSSYDDIPSKKLKRSAKEFSPGQEVQNYLNTIGQAIVGAGKIKQPNPEIDGDFDINKHGFLSYWLNKTNPMGGNPDIDAYLALDPVGPNGKRERTNRTRYLIHQLNSYLDNVKSGKIKFENSAFKNKDNYVSKIEDAITNLTNGWDDSDAASLQAIGITPTFYTAFMTDKVNPLLSEEEEAAEAEKNKKLAESQYITQLKGVYDDYSARNNTYTENNPISYIKDSRYDLNTAGAPERIGTALQNLGYPVDKDNLANSADMLWEATITAIRSGEKQVITPSGAKNISDILPIILPLYLNSNAEGAFKDSQKQPGVKYLDDLANDSKYGAILCYKNGKLYYDFIGNIKEGEAWATLKKDFHDKYMPKTTETPMFSFDKLGGVLRKLSTGGNVQQEDFDPETLAQLQELAGVAAQEEPGSVGMTPGQVLTQALYGPREAAAKAKGMSVEQYNLKQRSPNGQPDFFNEENGHWKTEDYVRLGAIAADIASLVMDPVSGAVTNVGSTATNFLADWADDSVTTTEMWKNLGMNLGMDALSIVPIVGDAAGTGSKLVKSVKTIAPKLMYGLTAWGVLGTLKNGSNILESFNKVMSDEKLTVGDWQNIAQAITAVAGVNGAVKSGVAKKLAKNRAMDSDAIGLGLKDKNGNVQDYIFRGDKAKELKQLITEGDISKVNAKIKDLDGFSDFEINTNLKTVPISVGLPIGRTVGTDGKKSWGAKNPFNVERNMDFFEIFDSSKLKGGYASRNLLNTNRQNAVEASRVLGNDHLKTKAEVDALVKAKIDKDAAAAVAATEKRKTLTQKAEEALSKKEAAYNEKSAQLQTTKQDLQKFGEARAKIDLSKPKKVTLVDANGKATSSTIKTESALDAKIAEFQTKEARKAALEQIQKRTHAEEKELHDLQIELASNAAEYQKLKDWKAEYNRARDLDNQIRNSTTLETQLTQELGNYDPDLRTLRERLAKLKSTSKTSKTQQLLDLINSKPYVVEYAPGKTRTVSDIKEIIANMNLLKKGGRLQFLKLGNEITALLRGVQFNKGRSWYNDVFKGYEQAILDNLKNEGYADTLNDKQTAHYNLYQAAEASGDWRKHAYEGANNSVGDYQNWYKNQGFNELGIQPHFQDRYVFGEGERMSGDRPGTFTSDNLYSAITDDRRVLGREGDWSDENLANFNEKLKKYNYTLAKNNENKYYYLQKLDTKSGVPGNTISEESPSKTTSTTVSTTPASSTPNTPTTPVSSSLISQPLISETSTTSGPSSFDLLSVPAEDYVAGGSGIPRRKGPRDPRALFNYSVPEALDWFRFGLLAHGNIKGAKIAKAAEIPFYQRPKNDNVKVMGSLQDIANGEREKAELINTGYSNPITSDATQQMGFIRQLASKGQERAAIGKQKDSEMRRTTEQMDIAQRKENHANEHMVGEQNRLAAIKTIKNKADIDKALVGQLHNDLDIKLKDIIAKQYQRKAKIDAATQNSINLAVKYNPNKYGANLTSKELAIYNKALTGASSANMSQDEINTLVTAKSKVAMATQDQQYLYAGIPKNPWSEDASKIPSSKPEFSVVLSKDGSKLHIARLRNRAKNADRFQKSIQKQIESLDKKLDRISKSMYGLPKSEIVNRPK